MRKLNWLAALCAAGLLALALPAQANELAPQIGNYNIDNLPQLNAQGLAVTANTLAVSGLVTNTTWNGTTANLGSVGFNQFNCTDQASNNSTVYSCGMFYDNYAGPLTSLSAARAALSSTENIAAPSAQTGITFKQYIGVSTAAQGTAGDGSVVTTTTATCTPATCTSGTVIPVAATSQVNGAVTWALHVGDTVSINLDAGGIGPNHYFTTIITNITGLNITISPAIPSQVTSGATFYDLSPAASMWGVAATCQNNPNNTSGGSDPPSNIYGCAAGEFDTGSIGQKIWDRFGVLVVGIGNQQGVGLDNGLTVAATTQSFQSGLAFSTVSGAAPVSTTGTLIQSQGAFSAANLIDFGSVTSCTGNDVSMPSFTVSCAGVLTLSNTAGPNITMTGAASSAKYEIQQTSGVNRWVWGCNGAEGGSNTGCDWWLLNYTDAGTLIGVPITVTRSTGLVTLANGEVITAGGLNVTGGYKAAGTAGVTCNAGISATTGRAVNGIITAC